MARQPKRIVKKTTRATAVRAAARYAAPTRAIESLEGRTLFAVFVWDGGGNNNNWTTGANWVGDNAPAAGDSVSFGEAGAARKSNTNDFAAGTVFENIVFTSGGWTIGGNPLVLNDDITATLATSGTNSVNMDITMSEGETPISSFLPGGATLIVNGNINSQGNTLRLAGVSQTTVNGVISGPGVLSKDASGPATLTGDNTYSGGTNVVASSTLTINHTGAGTATGTGPTTVSGDLRGAGRVGALTVASGGDLFPGVGNNSTGLLSTGDLSLGAGSRLGLNFNGTTAGTDYDQLAVTGAVTINPAATLQLTTGAGFTPGNGVTFTIISNDGGDAVSGTFANLAEGATVSVGGQTYQISYVGGDGNDVTLGTIEFNDPPVNSVPANQTMLENAVLTFSTPNNNLISLADPDAGSSPIQVTLAATHGVVTLSGTTGLTITAGANGSATVTVTGTATDVNAALSGLTYTPDADFVGAATLTLTTNDQGNTGPGGAQQDVDVINVTVNDQASQPPSANDDSVTRGVGEATTISVLSNDTDPLGRTLTVAVGNQPAGGAIVVNSDNTITYTPGAGFNGTDTFTYTVDNGAGGTDTATVTVTTTGAGYDQDPDSPSQTALFINGTDAGEKVVIKKRKGGGLSVLLGKTEIFSSASLPTGSVWVNGLGGDDVIAPGILKNSPFRIYGGDGNDKLTGGNLNDVIVGGIGNDKITAGRGNDIGIGGGGADKVAGAAGDDILISSSTDYNPYTAPNAAALRDILAVWNNGADYASRIAAIQSSAGVGTSGGKFSSSTIDADSDADVLTGASGSDLYFAQSNDKAKPQKNVETVVTIS
jgi:hypothetical protein